MNANSQSRKETETVNEKGEVEKRVEALDYRSSAGQFQELKNVQVVHQTHQKNNANTSGGVLATAAAAVNSTLQSAKDAISRK